MGKEGKPRIYVVDANIVYDVPRVIEELGRGGNIVVIPYQVLREMDTAKQGHDTIAFNVREAHRILNGLRAEHKIYPSARAAVDGTNTSFENGGKVAWGRPSIGAVKRHKDVYFPNQVKPDDMVLLTALDIKDNVSELETVLLAYDGNFLLEGDVFGLVTEDLRYGQVPISSPEELYSGVVELEVDGSVLDTFFSGAGLDKAVSINIVVRGSDEKYHELLEQLVTNQGVIMHPHDNQERVIVTRYNAERKTCECLRHALYHDRSKTGFESLHPRRIWGMTPGDSRQQLYMDFLLDPKIYFIAVNGKHGTGKTKLLIAGALQNLFGDPPQTEPGKKIKSALKEKHNSKYFRGLKLIRPEFLTGDFDPGTVPGGLGRKTEFFFRPLHDAIEDIARLVHCGTLLSELRASNLIEEYVTSYIKGIDVAGSVLCIDEGQNADRDLGKVLMARGGETAKMILCGDISQIDSGSDRRTRRIIGPRNNALSLITAGLRGKPSPNAAVITLTRNYRGGASTLADLLDENFSD